MMAGETCETWLARLNALRAEAEKKRLPEPEDMAPLDCCAELVRLGYQCDVDCGQHGDLLPTLRWHKGIDYRIRYQTGGETAEAYHQSALRIARKLDAQEAR